MPSASALKVRLIKFSDSSFLRATTSCTSDSEGQKAWLRWTKKLVQKLVAARVPLENYLYHPFSCPTSLLPLVRLLMSAGVVLTLLSTLVVLLHTPPSSPALLPLLFLCEFDSRLLVLDSVFQNFILNLVLNC